MRMPISARRRATAYAVTPYKPIPASLPGSLPGNPAPWKNVSPDGRRFVFAMPATATRAEARLADDEVIA
jgi:hypothetical protein